MRPSLAAVLFALFLATGPGSADWAQAQDLEWTRKQRAVPAGDLEQFSTSATPQLVVAARDFLHVGGLALNAPMRGVPAALVQSSSGARQGLLTCGVDEEAAGCEIILFDDRESFHRIRIPWARGMPFPVVALSDDERLAVGQPATGEVLILSSRGDEIARSIHGAGGVEPERALVLQWSPDGRELMVVAEIEPAGPGAPRSNIRWRTLSRDGVQLQSAELPGRALSAACRFAELTVVSAHDPWSGGARTFVLDRAGTIRASVGLLAERIRFHAASGGILLANKREFVVVDPDGTEEASIRLSDDLDRILDAGFVLDTGQVAWMTARIRFGADGFEYAGAAAYTQEPGGGLVRRGTIPGAHRRLTLGFAESTVFVATKDELLSSASSDGGGRRE